MSSTADRPATEPRTATIDEKRAVVNLLREADYYPDAGTSPAAGNDGVVEDDWDRYQSRLASAGFMLVPAEAAPRDSDHPEAQQRCQTITNARTYGGEDTIVQCWFFNSHVGPHWFNDEAQGAAPRAEGLPSDDVDDLVQDIAGGIDGEPYLDRSGWERAHASLKVLAAAARRPSDERDGEGE